MEEKKKYSNQKCVRNIAFFGDANITETDETYIQAFEAAEVLAKRGYVIIDGGGPGVMEAATSGAKRGGGKTVSITFDPIGAVGYEGRYIKNVTDTEVVTTNYIERMFKLLEYGDVFVIFKGGSGTVSEFGTAWVLAKLYYGHNKPIILYGEFWAEILDTFRKNMNIDSMEMSVFEICNSKDEVLNALDRIEKRVSKRGCEFNEDGSIDGAFKI